MVTQMLPAVAEAEAEKKTATAALQLLAGSDFEKDLEPMSAAAIARNNANTLLALVQYLNAEEVVNAVKANPHAHGNLEALLNVAAGLTLCFLAISTLFKQIVSWLFMLGALLHSGILYLLLIFNQAWASAVLGTGIRPALILTGLLLIGIAAIAGFRGEAIRDD